MKLLLWRCGPAGADGPAAVPMPVNETNGGRERHEPDNRKNRGRTDDALYGGVARDQLLAGPAKRGKRGARPACALRPLDGPDGSRGDPAPASAFGRAGGRIPETPRQFATEGRAAASGHLAAHSRPRRPKTLHGAKNGQCVDPIRIVAGTGSQGLCAASRFASAASDVDNALWAVALSRSTFRVSQSICGWRLARSSERAKVR